MMKKLKRGFIGPLGDDIPSIFPIVAGMLLFIGTILYANAQVDARNSELRLRQATQELGYLATQKASFQPGEFQRVCATSLRPFAENNALKFAVVVKRFCDRGCPTCGSGIDLENSNVYSENERAGPLEPESIFSPDSPDTNNVCYSDRDEGVRAQYINGRLDKSQAPKNAIVLNYPFTVPCPDPGSPVNGLATINIIVWK